MSGCGGRRQAATTATTPRKDAALSRKLAPGPRVAITRPPSAGPTARATLNDRLLRATACGSSRRPTSSGTVACQAGELIAVPSPMAKAQPRSDQAVIRPVRVSRPRAAAPTSIQSCETSSTRRRSRTSARAPAGRARRKSGSPRAAWTSETMAGDGSSEVISQPSPTSCIQVPMLEASEAIHRPRKSGRRSGDQGLEGAGAPASAVMAGADYRAAPRGRRRGLLGLGSAGSGRRLRLVARPGKRPGGTALHLLDDPLARGGAGIHPRPAPRIEDLRQAGEADPRVDAEVGLPNHGDLAVRVAPG